MNDQRQSAECTTVTGAFPSKAHGTTFKNLQGPHSQQKLRTIHGRPNGSTISKSKFKGRMPLTSTNNTSLMTHH